jgi:RNA polymerase sigma-70 factor (ECF subfamily)
MDPNDREIYQAAIRGDRDAFETIIAARAVSSSRSHTACCKIAPKPKTSSRTPSSRLGNPLARARPGEIPAWLATIARNRARDVARARPLDEALVDQLAHVGDEMSAKQDEQAREAYLGTQVHRALAALPETHRIALTLRYFDALDYATIEQTLGLTNGALRGILGRALQTMRKRLQPALASME